MTINEMFSQMSVEQKAKFICLNFVYKYPKFDDELKTKVYNELVEFLNTDLGGALNCQL